MVMISASFGASLLVVQNIETNKQHIENPLAWSPQEKEENDGGKPILKSIRLR